MLRCRLLTAVMVAALVVAAPAAARRGDSTAPALAGPAAAHVGETYTIWGSGFTPGGVVPLEIAEAGGCCIALNMVADATGRFSYTGEVWAAGTYRVRALAPRNGSGRWRIVASWAFEGYL